MHVSLPPSFDSSVTFDLERRVIVSEPAALREGRRRKQRIRRKEAIKRVMAFRRWIRRGCPPGECPGIPSKTDFKIAEGGR